jgi:hypothetical protein
MSPYVPACSRFSSSVSIARSSCAAVSALDSRRFSRFSVLAGAHARQGQHAC